MAKLAEKHAKRIAQSYNGMSVAKHMLDVNAAEYKAGVREWEQFNAQRSMWQAHGEQAYRVLRDEYGIEPIGWAHMFDRKG